MSLFNPFVLKKYSALIVASSLSTVAFFIGVKFFSLMVGIGAFLGAMLVSVFLGTILLKTPFNVMLEGKGLLCFDMNSTGMIVPFNISLQAPYMQGEYKGQNIKDIFDRAAVFQLSPPVNNSQPLKEDKDRNVTITLDQDKFNSAKFALYQYPVLVWNDNIKSLVTKDFFSEMERDAFAEHGVLYLNKQVEELNNHLLNFGRYVVENLKPATAWYKNKWVIIVLVIAFIIFLVLFAPAVIEQFKGFTAPATSAVSKTTGIVTRV